jgi:hypothetical protein
MLLIQRYTLVSLCEATEPGKASANNKLEKSATAKMLVRLLIKLD